MKNLVIFALVLLLGLAVYAIDLAEDRITELEIQNVELKHEAIEKNQDISECLMDNASMNDRVDEVIRKFG